MIEKEYKWLVSQPQFHAMLNEVKQWHLPEKTVVQTNHYYGSAPPFHVDDMTVRVREIEHGYTLQTKRAKKGDQEYRIAEEAYLPLPNLPAAITGRQIGRDDDSRFEYQGFLTTVRRTFDLDAQSHIDFDDSRYLGREDFEIELEFEQTPPQDLLNRWSGLPQNSVSKYQRFFEVWQTTGWDDLSVLSQTRQVAAELLKNETVATVSPDADLTQYGLDSLNMVQIVIALEDAFGFELPDYLLDLTAFSSLSQISQLVKFCVMRKDAEGSC